LPKKRIKTKLQVQTKTAAGAPLPDHHYASTWDAVVKIVAAEGPAGLYAGMTGCLIGVASQQFAYHYWYTLVRGAWLARSPTPPGTPVELALGAVAGMLASIFTIPVAVVTTRQQTVPKDERKSLLGTAREVIEGEDGWRGLWRGLRASLVLCINPSITYGATQRLRVLLFRGKKTLSPAEAFRASPPHRSSFFC
jgi:Mitochondrial carrier protein